MVISTITIISSPNIVVDSQSGFSFFRGHTVYKKYVAIYNKENKKLKRNFDTTNRQNK